MKCVDDVVKSIADCVFGELSLCQVACVILSAGVEELTASESTLFVCALEVVTYVARERPSKVVELDEAARGLLKFKKGAKANS
jgi:hypothetical protein